MSEEKKLVTFLDNVSRTVIGKVVSETSEVLEVENPVVVHTVPQQDPASGQMKMSLQLFPIFFREFMAEKDAHIVWSFKKANITLPKVPVVFDFKLHAQYENLFAPLQQAPVAPVQSQEPIKLFDNE